MNLRLVGGLCSQRIDLIREMRKMQQQRKTVKQDEILFGKVLYTLLYLKRITARPAVSTGPACSVVGGSLDGRGCGEEWIHVYVRLGPLTGPPKLPLHC